MYICFYNAWVYIYTRGKYTCRKRTLHYQFKVKHSLENSISIKMILRVTKVDISMLVARNARL